MWTRRQLKDKAKATLRMNYWKTVLVALLVMILGASISASASVGSSGGASYRYRLDPTTRTTETRVITDDMTPEEAEEALNEMFDDEIAETLTDPDASIEDLVESTNVTVQGPSIPGEVVAVAIFVGVVLLLVLIAVAISFDAFVMNPLSVGFHRFFIRNLNQPAEVKEIAYAFDNNYRETVKTMFFRDLYTLLWALLLIIPGIVKAYEYRMIPYLLADDPTMTMDRAFAESRRMMHGNKWRAFVLDLSFFGWIFLSIWTLGVLAVFYVAPYELMTNAALYEALRYGTPEPELAAGNAAPIAPSEVPVAPFAAVGAPAPVWDDEPVQAGDSTFASGSVVPEAPEE